MSKSKKTKRCQFPQCSKKLTLVQRMTMCKCKKAFCAQHRAASQHNCSFDYQMENKCLLKEKLLIGKVVNCCMEKI